jgi:hypothetical protein
VRLASGGFPGFHFNFSLGKTRLKLERDESKLVCFCNRTLQIWHRLGGVVRSGSNPGDHDGCGNVCFVILALREISREGIYFALCIRYFALRQKSRGQDRTSPDNLVAIPGRLEHVERLAAGRLRLYGPAFFYRNSGKFHLTLGDGVFISRLLAKIYRLLVFGLRRVQVTFCKKNPGLARE